MSSQWEVTTEYHSTFRIHNDYFRSKYQYTWRDDRLLAQSIAGEDLQELIPLLQHKLRSKSSDNGISGDIIIRNEAKINTLGDNSAGALIQSIGGGGGATALSSSGKNSQNQLELNLWRS